MIPRHVRSVTQIVSKPICEEILTAETAKWQADLRVSFCRNLILKKLCQKRCQNEWGHNCLNLASRQDSTDLRPGEAHSMGRRQFPQAGYQHILNHAYELEQIGITKDQLEAATTVGIPGGRVDSIVFIDAF